MIKILSSEGHSAAEIADILGQSPYRIERIARGEAVKLAGAGGRRRMTFGMRKRHYRTLEVLALMAKVSRAVMAERVMASALDRGANALMKDLGKDVKPKRQYIHRKRKPATASEPVS